MPLRESRRCWPWLSSALWPFSISGRRSGFGPSPYIAPLSGLVYRGSTYSGDPATEAARAMKGALKKRGVKVTGGVKIGSTPRRLTARRPLASVSSPTIAAIAEATNKPSNNFYAEMLLKRIAASGGKGTTTRGATLVERFARKNAAGVSATDGSGLTRSNRGSAKQVGRLLAAMRKHDAAEEFDASLAVAGRDGTLAGRMQGTRAEGRCRDLRRQAGHQSAD